MFFFQQGCIKLIKRH